MYYKKNVEIIIEPISEMFLLGTTIDYIEQDYENIFEKNLYLNQIKI